MELVIHTADNDHLLSFLHMLQLLDHDGIPLTVPQKFFYWIVSFRRFSAIHQLILGMLFLLHPQILPRGQLDLAEKHLEKHPDSFGLLSI